MNSRKKFLVLLRSLHPKRCVCLRVLSPTNFLLERKKKMAFEVISRIVNLKRKSGEGRGKMYKKENIEGMSCGFFFPGIVAVYHFVVSCGGCQFVLDAFPIFFFNGLVDPCAPADDGSIHTPCSQRHCEPARPSRGPSPTQSDDGSSLRHAQTTLL